MTERIVFDAGAWIEYLDGSSRGAVVKTILEKDAHIFTSPITASEVYSKLRREGKDWIRAQEAILANSTILPILEEHAAATAEIHARLKIQNKNIGLADCYVMELATRFKAKIITTDPDFKPYKNILLLS